MGTLWECSLKDSLHVGDIIYYDCGFKSGKGRVNMVVGAYFEVIQMDTWVKDIVWFADIDTWGIE